MPIAPYDRSSLPLGMDNSAYGRPCGVTSLFDLSASRSFPRTVTRLPDMNLPASCVFDANGRVPNIPRHLEACPAKFLRGFTGPSSARLFMPSHGALIRDGEENVIVAESLWHDDLFFSGPFRNDASTDWRWRIDDNWSHSLRYDDVVNHCYHRFHYQYFHWMMDCLPRVWMLRKHSNHAAAKWLVGPLDRQFHLPSLDLLGIGADDCLLVPHGSIARFENLVVPAFMFQEPLETLRPDYNSGIHHIGWSKDYLDDIRALAWNKHGAATEPDLRLYVGRGDATHRQLRNEEDVWRLLKVYGFMRIEPGTMPFAQQVEVFSRARVVVGLHGAGMTNVMWARSPAEILEFASDELRDTGYRFLSNLCGHNHSLIGCRTFDHPQGVAYADLEIDLAALGHALGHMLAGEGFALGSVTIAAGVALDQVHEVDHEHVGSLHSAEVSLAERDYAQALRQVLVYCSHNSGDGWGWLLAGRVYRALGDVTAMGAALDRALNLPDKDPHVGAAFELLHSAAILADFSKKGLIDFALSEAKGGQQERWYKGGLLFIKALAYLHDGDFAQADRTLQQVYAFRTDIDERNFLFPWVAARLSERGSLEGFPYLRYLAQRAAAGADHIDYQGALDALPDDTVVVEIGAMDGVRFDTLHRSLVSRGWHATLVEPTRDMFNQLVSNFQAFPNVRCVCAAISDRGGPLRMHRIDPAAVAEGQVEDWALGLSALSPDKTLKFYAGLTETEEVEALTFADFVECEGIDRIDVLQIDTEGHDFIVFDQIDFDRYTIRVLHIELVNLDPIDRLTIFERLRRHGYRCYYDGNDLTAVRPR